jgi:hypothetical protein
MGAALATGLAQRLSLAGLDPAAVRLESLLDPLAQAATQFDGALRTALGGALQAVFVIGFVAAVVGLAITALAPGGRVTQMGKSATSSARVIEPVAIE